MTKNDLIILLIIWILFVILLSGCTHTPNSYYDSVRVINGKYSNKIGRIVGDCGGFENYKVKLLTGRVVCVKIWNLEKI